MRRRQIFVLAPLLGCGGCGALMLAAMLAVSAITGAGTAAGDCGTSNRLPSSVRGAPRQLQPLFEAAAARYRLGVQGAAILAGLTSIESGFGQNMGPSSAGAIGWTQFLPSTWEQYGVDADHDGRRDPYTAADAIFSSARYLRASGAPSDWHRALFAYNHSDAYVAAVLERARQLAGTEGAGAPTNVPENSILVVGDSLQVGTFPRLNALLGGNVVGDFENGRPSAAGIAVLRRLLSERTYATIVFDLGTNDATVDELRDSLTRLARMAGDAHVFVASVNSPFFEAAKNATLRRYAQTHPSVTLIRWHQASRGLALADGVHGAYTQRATLFAKSLSIGVSTAPRCSAVTNVSTGPIRRVSGDGQLVPIPGQTGMSIDSRILSDVLYLVRTYRVRVTAGYAPSGHEPTGEHPLGLAVDLVPGPNGTWDDVDRLARWAEPTQNAPRPPFRWVGYAGDADHGRGDHLHLSWIHAPAPSRRPPAAWVNAFSPAETMT